MNIRDTKLDETYEALEKFKKVPNCINWMSCYKLISKIIKEITMLFSVNPF
jgi:hypothetical protein